MKQELPEFWLNTSKISRTAVNSSLEADPASLSVFAKALDVDEVLAATAEIEASAWHSGGVALIGEVNADVVQSCAVTLEPIQTKVSQEFRRNFVPEGHLLAQIPDIVDGEIILDPKEDETPDVYSSNRINLWAVVIEELVLAIDPFIRRDEICKPEIVEDSAVEIRHHRPFADLKTLITEKNYKKPE